MKTAREIYIELTGDNPNKLGQIEYMEWLNRYHSWLANWVQTHHPLNK